MPAENNTNPAKTPIFTRFFTNSRLWYGRVRLHSPLQKIIENSGVKPRFVLFSAGMPSKPASELTGLTVGTLNRHAAKGNLIGAVIAGKMLISKQSLIGHIAFPETVRKVGAEQLR